MFRQLQKFSFGGQSFKVFATRIDLLPTQVGLFHSAPEFQTHIRGDLVLVLQQVPSDLERVSNYADTWFSDLPRIVYLGQKGQSPHRIQL